jgi:multiple sugar transport system substrate-binding protein
VHPFLTGRIAMYGCGSWNPSAFVDADFEWEVAHWPRGEITNERITQGNSDGFSIFRDAGTPDAAWELLYYMTGPEQPGTVMWASIFSSVPGTKDLARSNVFLGQEGLPATYHIIVDDLEYAQSKHIGVAWMEWLDAMGQALEAGWSGELSLEEAADKAVGDINAVLDAI